MVTMHAVALSLPFAPALPLFFKYYVMAACDVYKLLWLPDARNYFIATLSEGVIEQNILVKF